MEHSFILQEPLEKLPSLLNNVLIEIGKTFRDVSRQEPRASNRAKGSIRQSIPQVNSTFHEALDEIEIGILKAKAAMEQDLELLRAKRAERERAAGIVRLRASSREASPGKPSPAQKADRTEFSGILDDVPAPETMNNGFILGEHDTATTDEKSLHHVEDFTEDLFSEQPNEKQESDESIPLPVATDHVMSTNASAFEDLDFNALDDNPSHMDDFDSMFGPPDPAGNANSNDSVTFDLDFSTEASMTQDLLQNGSFVDLNNSNSFANASNEDIVTLLPGVESYLTTETSADTHDNFMMMDLAPTSSNFQESSASTKIQPMNKEAQSNVVASGLTESNLDDPFGQSTDLNMEDGDMEANAEIGDFGDLFGEWFDST